MNKAMFSKLNLVLNSAGHYELLEDFKYYHLSGTITVPAGFQTDLDSVPRIPVIYAAFKGRTTKAAVVHDFLYESQRGKEFADRIFLDAMKDEGLAWYPRTPIYWAVKFFGTATYERKRS